MLVSFALENWKSFRGFTKINFIAGRKRSHSETLAKPSGYAGLKLLPISGIWGGNAGGKTNLLEALAFVKQFVSFGFNDAGHIPVEPFRPASIERPTYFAVSFLAGNRIYQLEFTLTVDGVQSEALYWMTPVSPRDWRIIYERTTGESGDAKVDFSDTLPPELKAVPDIMDQLKACERGCGPYRLFLTNTVNQRIDVFAPLADWFMHTLRFAGSGTKYTRFSRIMSDERYCHLFGTILRKLDTGVEQVELEDADSTEVLSLLPEYIRRDIQTRRQVSMQIELGAQSDIPSEVYLLTKQDRDVRIRRVQTYRRSADGILKPFGFNNESSGTRRLLELLPIFTDLWGGDSECVWLLDEIDKEFHTDLTRALIETFLSSAGSASRRQMLFTTHDLLLMEQSLLRVDEINVTERKRNGESVLIPLHKYKGLRNDLDLRRSYLDGRFGGVPKLAPINVDIEGGADDE